MKGLKLFGIALSIAAVSAAAYRCIAAEQRGTVWAIGTGDLRAERQFSFSVYAISFTLEWE